MGSADICQVLASMRGGGGGASFCPLSLEVTPVPKVTVSVDKSPVGCQVEEAGPGKVGHDAGSRGWWVCGAAPLRVHGRLRGLRTSRVGAGACAAGWHRSAGRRVQDARLVGGTPTQARSSRRSQEGALACRMGQTGGHRRRSRSGCRASRHHPARQGRPSVPSTSLPQTFSTSSSSTSRMALIAVQLHRTFPGAG